MSISRTSTPVIGVLWRASLLGVAFCVGAGCASPHDGPASTRADGIAIHDAAAPAPIVTGDTAATTMSVYLTITNRGAPDTLYAVSTPVARSAAVHTEMMRGGMAMMMPSTPLEIGRDGELRLTPGSLHVMLDSLTQIPHAGDTIPLSLHFRRSGDIAVLAAVVRYVDLDSVLHLSGASGAAPVP